MLLSKAKGSISLGLILIVILLEFGAWHCYQMMTQNKINIKYYMSFEKEDINLEQAKQKIIENTLDDYKKLNREEFIIKYRDWWVDVYYLGLSKNSLCLVFKYSPYQISMEVCY